mgnify:CR=1 FL=1
MRGKFSFLGHDLEIILSQSRQLLPGIRRMDAFYHDSSTETFTAVTINPEDDPPEPYELMIEGKAEPLLKLIHLKSSYSWYADEELPYNIKGSSPKIPDVFSELNKVVLMIRLSNDDGSARDALVIYFREKMSNFGMNLAQKELTAEHKEIIAHMLINMVTTVRNIARLDRTVWNPIKEIMKENHFKMDQTTRKLDDLMQRYQERLVDSCNYFLSNISANEGRKYVFTEGALRLIKSSSVEYYKIENAIKLAVQLANNFHSDDEGPQIEITENFLNFNAAKLEEEKSDLADTVYEKPFNYLTSLELLAEKVKAKNLQVKSQTVVDEMENPVNPSAITWMVNHNMKAIQHLFRLYPDKWPIIRNEFKPILRIIKQADQPQRIKRSE